MQPVSLVVLYLCWVCKQLSSFCINFASPKNKTITHSRKCCFLSGLRLAQYLWLATPKDSYSLWNTAVQDIIFQDLKKIGLQRAWNKVV